MKRFKNYVNVVKMEVAPEPNLDTIRSLADIPPEEFVEAKELLNLQSSISETERKSRDTFIKSAAVGTAAALLVGATIQDFRITAFLTTTLLWPASFALTSVVVPQGPLNELKDKLEATQARIPQLSVETKKKKRSGRLSGEAAPDITSEELAMLQSGKRIQTQTK